MVQSKTTKLPVLRSESADDYLALRARLTREIKPEGAIEEIYLQEITTLIWEVQRLRSFRISIIHQAFSKALQSVLEQLLFNPDLLMRPETEIKAHRLAQGWLADDAAAKKQVADIFNGFDLDESAIEAEATRANLDQLRYFDEAISSASRRLDKALRMVMDYRGSNFVVRLRQKSGQILNEPPAAQPGSGAEQKAA